MKKKTNQTYPTLLLRIVFLVTAVLCWFGGVFEDRVSYASFSSNHNIPPRRRNLRDNRSPSSFYPEQQERGYNGYHNVSLSHCYNQGQPMLPLLSFPNQPLPVYSYDSIQYQPMFGPSFGSSTGQQESSYQGQPYSLGGIHPLFLNNNNILPPQTQLAPLNGFIPLMQGGQKQQELSSQGPIGSSLACIAPQPVWPLLPPLQQPLTNRKNMTLSLHSPVDISSLPQSTKDALFPKHSSLKKDTVLSILSHNDTTLTHKSQSLSQHPSQGSRVSSPTTCMDLSGCLQQKIHQLKEFFPNGTPQDPTLLDDLIKGMERIKKLTKRWDDMMGMKKKNPQHSSLVPLHSSTGDKPQVTISLPDKKEQKVPENRINPPVLCTDSSSSDVVQPPKPHLLSYADILSKKKRWKESSMEERKDLECYKESYKDQLFLERKPPIKAHVSLQAKKNSQEKEFKAPMLRKKQIEPYLLPKAFHVRKKKEVQQTLPKLPKKSVLNKPGKKKRNKPLHPKQDLKEDPSEKKEEVAWGEYQERENASDRSEEGRLAQPNKVKEPSSYENKQEEKKVFSKTGPSEKAEKTIKQDQENKDTSLLHKKKSLKVLQSKKVKPSLKKKKKKVQKKQLTSTKKSKGKKKKNKSSFSLKKRNDLPGFSLQVKEHERLKHASAHAFWTTSVPFPTPSAILVREAKKLIPEEILFEAIIEAHCNMTNLCNKIKIAAHKKRLNAVYFQALLGMMAFASKETKRLAKKYLKEEEKGKKVFKNHLKPCLNDLLNHLLPNKEKNMTGLVPLLLEQRPTFLCQVCPKIIFFILTAHHVLERMIPGVYAITDQKASFKEFEELLGMRLMDGSNLLLIAQVNGNVRFVQWAIEHYLLDPLPYNASGKNIRIYHQKASLSHKKRMKKVLDYLTQSKEKKYIIDEEIKQAITKAIIEGDPVTLEKYLCQEKICLKALLPLRYKVQHEDMLFALPLLHFIVFHYTSQKTGCLKLFLEYFVGAAYTSIGLHERDSQGNNIVVFCGFLNKMVPLQMIMARYACLDISSHNLRGRTALHWFVFHHHLEAVKYILEKQPTITDAMDGYGVTCLQYACIENALEVIPLLLKAGMHPNLTYGQHPSVFEFCLDKALFAPLYKMVETINHKSTFYILHLKGKYHVGHLVLTYHQGAQPFLKKQYIAFLSLLLEKHGLSPMEKDPKGKTLISRAEKANGVEIEKILKDYLKKQREDKNQLNAKHSDDMIDLSDEKKEAISSVSVWDLPQKKSISPPSSPLLAEEVCSLQIKLSFSDSLGNEFNNEEQGHFLEKTIEIEEEMNPRQSNKTTFPLSNESDSLSLGYEEEKDDELLCITPQGNLPTCSFVDLSLPKRSKISIDVPPEEGSLSFQLMLRTIECSCFSMECLRKKIEVAQLRKNPLDRQSVTWIHSLIFMMYLLESNIKNSNSNLYHWQQEMESTILLLEKTLPYKLAEQANQLCRFYSEKPPKWPGSSSNMKFHICAANKLLYFFIYLNDVCKLYRYDEDSLGRTFLFYIQDPKILIYSLEKMSMDMLSRDCEGNRINEVWHRIEKQHMLPHDCKELCNIYISYVKQLLPFPLTKNEKKMKALKTVIEKGLLSKLIEVIKQYHIKKSDVIGFIEWLYKKNKKCMFDYIIKDHHMECHLYLVQQDLLPLYYRHPIFPSVNFIQCLGKVKGGIKQLIQYSKLFPGLDINSKDDTGSNVAFYHLETCINGVVANQMKVLSELGVNLHAVNKEKENLLFGCTKAGNEKGYVLLQELIQVYQLDYNQTNKAHQTLVSIAFKNEAIQFLEYLIGLKEINLWFEVVNPNSNEPVRGHLAHFACLIPPYKENLNFQKKIFTICFKRHGQNFLDECISNAISLRELLTDEDFDNGLLKKVLQEEGWFPLDEVQENNVSQNNV